MIELLKEYLLVKKRLPLAGLGVLHWERESARFDLGNRQFLPPRVNYSFSADPQEPTSELSEWLAARMGLDATEAMAKYRRFCEELIQLLASGNKPSWTGWGQWVKDEHGGIQFITDTGGTRLSPVTANKVIRDHAEHMVRVGEDNRSSVEMSQLLLKKEINYPIERIITWCWLVLAALWLSWHFYNRSFSTDALASPAPVKTTMAPKNYQEF